MPKFSVYGLLVGVATVVAWEVSKKVARIRGVEQKTVEEVFGWVVVGGVIGARAYHVIDLWGVYSQNLASIFYLWNGGLGIWGAIGGGFTGLWLFWFLRDRKISLLKLLDVAVVGLPLAQAIGRMGNFVNGELYGKATSLPFGIYIKETGGYHHPLFAYEAILNLILFVVLWKKVPQNTSLTGVYLIGYGIIRGSLEWLRPDEVVWRLGGWPMAVIFSLLAILLGGVLVRQRRN